jgi:hypothetical protein
VRIAKSHDDILSLYSALIVASITHGTTTNLAAMMTQLSDAMIFRATRAWEKYFNIQGFSWWRDRIAQKAEAHFDADNAVFAKKLYGLL